jgi:hypothetical protein
MKNTWLVRCGQYIALWLLLSFLLFCLATILKSGAWLRP